MTLLMYICFAHGGVSHVANLSVHICDVVLFLVDTFLPILHILITWALQTWPHPPSTP